MDIIKKMESRIKSQVRVEPHYLEITHNLDKEGFFSPYKIYMRFCNWLPFTGELELNRIDATYCRSFTSKPTPDELVDLEKYFINKIDKALEDVAP